MFKMNGIAKGLLLGGVAASVAAASGAGTAMAQAGFDYHGYFRAGIGANSENGDQECFSNPGTPVPKDVGRLGNECDIFAEWYLLADHVKGETEKDPWFRSRITLAYGIPGDEEYESAPIYAEETYVEAGNVLGAGLVYWAGKRFYREADMHILDWRPFANTSGDGAGVQIPTGVMGSRLDLAYLRRTEDTTSDSGRHAVGMYDLRWRDLQLGSNLKLMLWLAFASSTGGDAVDDTGAEVKYEGGSGNVVGAKATLPLLGGENNFTISQGSALLAGQNMWASAAATEEQRDIQDDKSTLRVTNDLVIKVGDRLGLFVDLAWQTMDNGMEEDEKETMFLFATRPIIFLTDTFNVALEYGHSEVEIESEKDEAGDDVGARTLDKFTVAAQLAPGRGVWDRPVLRAFYTAANWNDENEGLVGGSAYADDTSGSTWGFQTEVWW